MQKHKTLLGHLLVVVAVSVGYESLFIHHGLNRFDESWPLYAAMRLHAGGVLYHDAFFLFPPGHVISAWLAYAWDPPGFELARVFYAGFSVAMCAAMYLLGRRIMSPSFALLGALILALASPRGHLFQLLFGYRYFVFSALALLAFSARARSGDAKWMFWAGLAIGVGVFFRVSPPFAVSVGIAVAVMSCDPDWRRWLRDWGLCSLGALLVLLPLALWMQASVGLDVIWRELFVRLLALQSAQSFPFPDLALPQEWSRKGIFTAFVGFQYHLYPLLFAVYIGSLLVLWSRARRRGTPFEHSLLLALAITAAIFFLRAIGRSDEPHLDSAFPPTALLLAHLAGLVARKIPAPAKRRSAVAVAVWVASLASWIYLPGIDLYLDPATRGLHRIHSAGDNISIPWPRKAWDTDRVAKVLSRHTQPGDIILNLSESPMFHLLADRMGPGYLDIVVPATFIDEAEELAFLERVKARPPSAVIWPEHPFDHMPSRSLAVIAPHLSGWVKQNYTALPRPQQRWIVMFPNDRGNPD